MVGMVRRAKAVEAMGTDVMTMVRLTTRGYDGCMNGGFIDGGTADNGGTTVNGGYTKTDIKVDATPISSTTDDEPTIINDGILPKTATTYPFAGAIGAGLVALGYILRKNRN
jgi:LPXTG-motif cell wall-anchored protein